jgi:hypothetical protein
MQNELINLGRVIQVLHRHAIGGSPRPPPVMVVYEDGAWRMAKSCGETEKCALGNMECLKV